MDSVTVREFFRTMDDDHAGCPRCGTSDALLGARVPGDIEPDDEGNVKPETGGMSAAADHPRFLPPHFRPAVLPGGRSTLPVFSIRADQLGSALAARLKKRHVFIEPAVVMPLAAFQASLCDTRASWRRAE